MASEEDIRFAQALANSLEAREKNTKIAELGQEVARLRQRVRDLGQAQADLERVEKEYEAAMLEGALIIKSIQSSLM